MIRTMTALTLLALTAGCGGDSPAAQPEPPAPFTLVGDVTVLRPNMIWNENPTMCAGTGGYDDMRVGAQVVVTDENSTTIAVGSIDSATPMMDPDDGNLARGCSLGFSVAGVPEGRQFYGVEVTSRGRLQYTRDQMKGRLQLSFN
jgi:hypothetical protein